jgi:hypothetical protein
VPLDPEPEAEELLRRLFVLTLKQARSPVAPRTPPQVLLEQERHADRDRQRAHQREIHRIWARTVVVVAGLVFLAFLILWVQPTSPELVIQIVAVLTAFFAGYGIRGRQDSSGR